MTSNGHDNQLDGVNGKSGNRTLMVVLITVVLIVGVPAIVIGGLVLSGRSDDAVNVKTEDGIATGVDDLNGSTSTNDDPKVATTEGQSNGSGGLDGASTSPTSVPFPVQDTALLTDVRVGRHDGFDRVTFEFDGDAPGFRASYVDELTEDGSGAPVAIDGVPLQIVFGPASGVDLSGVDYKETYTGPKQITWEGQVISELKMAGDFEGQLTWGLGVSSKAPFRVSTLANPSRIVIDVQVD